MIGVSGRRQSLYTSRPWDLTLEVNCTCNSACSDPHRYSRRYWTSALISVTESQRRRGVTNLRLIDEINNELATPINRVRWVPINESNYVSVFSWKSYYVLVMSRRNPHHEDEVNPDVILIILISLVLLWFITSFLFWLIKSLTSLLCNILLHPAFCVHVVICEPSS